MTNHINSNGIQGSTAVGLEATLDVSVAAAALPANASITVVSSPSNSGWYGLFVNMAQACGLEFDGDPWTGLRELSLGPDYPVGGCIISLSYGGPEALQGTSSRADADSVISQLASLGVIVAISAGDEGSGGCFAASGNLFGNSAFIDISQVSITSNIATFTTSTAHGFALRDNVFLAALPDPSLDGMYQIITVPTTTTFTVGLNNPDLASTAITAGAMVNFGPLEPQYPATNPNVLAVGGTQWDSQSVSLVNKLSTPYVPGTNMANYVWWDNFPNSNCANLPAYPSAGGEATGGGQSAYYDMPGFQQSVATANYPALPAQRMMPDLAALAGWPMYAIANPGVSITGASVIGNVATVYVPNTYGFGLGESITIDGLPTPFNILDGTRTITAGSPTSIEFAFTNADIPAARVTSGSASQSCTAPCANTTFPWFPVVGTSAATPLVAMGIANVNAVLSARGLARITNNGSSMDIHNIVYSTQNSSAFTDVTSGSNDIHSLGGYNALSGFDMTTGMGVPNFTTLASLLIARQTPSDGGGGSPPPAAPTSPAGTPVVIEPAVISPEPVQPIINQPPLGNLGNGVLVSTGPNAAATPRLVASKPVTRKRTDAPRLRIPIRKWRVPVVTVPGVARDFAVQIRIGNSWKGAGITSSSKNGKAVLPSLRFARKGNYPVRLIDGSGRTYLLVMRARPA